jgi:hypothetical protein
MTGKWPHAIALVQPVAPRFPVRQATVKHAGNGWAALRRNDNPTLIGESLAEIAETAETPADRMIRTGILSLQFLPYAGTCSLGTQLRASPA